MKKENTNPLWTRDFTIITLGSVVSMVGNSLSGFAMSLMVLDYTSSSLFYAIYNCVLSVVNYKNGKRELGDELSGTA